MLLRFTRNLPLEKPPLEWHLIDAANGAMRKGGLPRQEIRSLLPPRVPFRFPFPARWGDNSCLARLDQAERARNTSLVSAASLASSSPRVAMNSLSWARRCLQAGRGGKQSLASTTQQHLSWVQPAGDCEEARNRERSHRAFARLKTKKSMHGSQQLLISARDFCSAPLGLVHS